MTSRIYFDNAATTPLDPRVFEAMRPVLRRRLRQSFEPAPRRAGSPRGGRDGQAQVAELIGAEPGEIVFTGSGTEADNLAIAGRGSRPFGRPLPRGHQRHRASGRARNVAGLERWGVR